MEKIIKIDGMGCQHCVNSVNETLSALDGVKVLNVVIGEAKVELPADYDFSVIVEALDDIGFEVI